MKGFEEWGLMIVSALINFILYPIKPKIQTSPRRILVVKPDHIGDLILAIPAIKSLKSAFPRSKITALIGEWCFPLVELIPEIDEAIAYKPRIFARGTNRSSLTETIRLFTKLKRGGFDMAVDLRATWLSIALAASKGFKQRIDRSSHRIRMKLRGKSSIWDHEIERNLAPLREAGIPVRTSFKPALVLSQRIRGEAQKLLSSFSISETDLLVAFHPGSPVKLKRWSSKYFAELGDMLSRELKAKILIVGSSSESDISSRIVRYMETKPVDLTGRTDLPTLAGVLERCDLFVGNDSGPMHIAAALGVKTIGIFGPSSPERFGPYGDHCLALRAKIGCPPCMSERCRLRPDGCINEISVEEVFQAVSELLSLNQFGHGLHSHDSCDIISLGGGGSHRMSSEGQIIVISGPSGSGKTSLVKLLLERNPSLRRSISATTRPPRSGEQDGRDYYFMDVKRFKKGIEAGEFIEWTIYNGNYYGTPRKPVDEAIAKGEDILLTIDVRGADQIRRLYPDALLIFILPSSPELLEERIRKRGGESEEEIKQRLQIAKDEISKIDIYDFFVVNKEGRLEEAVEEIERIISVGKRRLTKGRIDMIKRSYEVIKV